MGYKKKILYIVIFFAVMLLTFMAVFSGKDLGAVWTALQSMQKGYLFLAIGVGILFTAMEGIIIWYLMNSLHEKVGFWRCIKYAFIGFFYSGITPSATGGQPMQLYSMKKDGNSMSMSSVVLMTVAIMYKLVLVIMGLLIFLFWRHALAAYISNYMWLFILGMILNSALVVALLGVMLVPGAILQLGWVIIDGLAKVRIVKQAWHWKQRVEGFVKRYSDIVRFMRSHGHMLFVTLLITVVQRCLVFGLTYIVYRGFGFDQVSALVIMMLQTVVYISVDMLPLPGSQGVTELVYQKLFAGIFTGGYLYASMMVSRGISFYLLLIIGLVTVAFDRVMAMRR